MDLAQLTMGSVRMGEIRIDASPGSPRVIQVTPRKGSPQAPDLAPKEEEQGGHSESQEQTIEVLGDNHTSRRGAERMGSVRHRKKKQRRLTSTRDLAERHSRQISVAEWAAASRVWAEEVAQGQLDNATSSCAMQARLGGDEGMQPSPFASSGPRLGVGGGVGAPVPPNGVETPVKELEEGEAPDVPAEDKDAPVEVVQTGNRHQPIPARQRRKEPELTSIQQRFMPIIDSDPFYYTVMGAIAINCIQLAVTSPLEPSPDPQAMQDANLAIDWLLFGIFNAELVLKHLALYPMGYWSDNWNRLDGTIVLFGYLTFVPGVGDLTFFRVLRIIRPLRVLGKLEGMKKILVTIGAAAEGLKDTMYLCILIFFMFGIVGCTLFAGVTRHRCFTTADNGTTWALDEDNGRPCGGWYTCPAEESCMFHSDAPSYSIISFDNILIGFLTLFVNITLEGWVDVMYLIQDGYGYGFATIYYLLLIVFGSLFVLNLALAVIADAYENQEEDWEFAAQDAQAALCLVQLDEEAGSIAALCQAVDELRTEREGLEAAVDFSRSQKEPEKETALLEDEVTRVLDEMKAVAGKINDIGEYLVSQEGCQAEGELVKLIGPLIEESIEEEEEAEDLTAEEMEAKWEVERQAMSGWQAGLHKLATSGPFDKVIMFFIIFNTVCLAMEHTKDEVVNGVMQAVEMDQDIDDTLTYLNFVFIVVFTLEVVVKLGGLFPKVYFSDSFNCFDFFIVLMSYVELGFADNSSLSALRTFRLARVLKLAKNWKSLRDLMNTILDTLPAMSYLSVLLLLFMFIASVAGMMFYGGKFDGPDIEAIQEGGRHKFDNFGVSMLTVFQMLTGENWNSVLYDGMYVTRDSALDFIITIMYFLTVQILGGFVVLNLFLAILLSNFDEPDDDDGSAWPALGDLTGMCFVSSKVEPEPIETTPDPADPSDTAEAPSVKVDDTGAGVDNKSNGDVSNGAVGSGTGSEGELTGDMRAAPVDVTQGMAAFNQVVRSQEAEEALKPKIVLGIEDMDVKGNAAFCFPHDDTLRRRLALIVGWTEKGKESINTPFANFIFLMIIVSSVTLAIDGPTLNCASDMKNALNILDIVFTAIFLLEMVMKIIVYGFIFTEDAYLKDGWNMLDFFIVVTSVLALPANPVLSGPDCTCGCDSPFSSLKVLRTFRALRPLRMINRAPGLKVVVDAIFECLPAFFNIGLVSWLVYLVFAIMGVQLWAGKFWACDIEDVADVTACVAAGGTWANKPLNFDNVLNAQLTLFEVASLEIWLDVMYAAMDVPSKLGEQPVTKDGTAILAALYFIVFIIIGSFLMLNLFVGAVVDNFNRIKSNMDKKGAIMTEEQEAFVQSMKTMFNKKPSAKPMAPSKEEWGGLRYKVFKFLHYDLFAMREAKLRKNEGLSPQRKDGTPLFDHVIMFLIAFNIIVMAAPIWKQPPDFTVVGSVAAATAQETSWNVMLENINIVFNFIFVIECSLKLTGLGAKQYFSSNMNTFDFAIVTVSVLGFVIDQALENVDPGLLSIISVIKAGRVVRIFRLAMRIKGIRKLLETLIYTMPSLINVSMLLAIVLFIYTVLGMAFFGEQQYGQPPFELYNEHANFRHFWIGFITLFRMSTGESWNGIMHDSMENVHKKAWIYYFTYMIVGSSLLFQLIVAVVLEQFASAQSEEESVVRPDDIEQFAMVWREFDPEEDQLIPFAQLPSFLKNLDPPLGIGMEASTKDQMIFMRETGLKSHNSQAHYVETFFCLVIHAYKSKLGRRWKGTLDADIIKDLTAEVQSYFPTIDSIDNTNESDAVQNFAALKIQSITRRRMASKRSAAKSEEKHGLAGLVKVQDQVNTGDLAAADYVLANASALVENTVVPSEGGAGSNSPVSAGDEGELMPPPKTTSSLDSERSQKGPPVLPPVLTETPAAAAPAPAAGAEAPPVLPPPVLTETPAAAPAPAPAAGAEAPSTVEGAAAPEAAAPAPEEEAAQAEAAPAPAAETEAAAK